MRYIDMQNWPRREHFKLFSAFNHPHFGMCANVDLTAFHPYVKQRGFSFTVAVAYLISRASNSIPEFRHRIRDEKVVEHEVVHPSVTILTEGDLFSFCTLVYVDDFTQFSNRAEKMIAHVKAHPTLKNEPGKDDVLYMTVIPWVSFTSFIHPMNLHPEDSIPRFAWGKFFQEGGQLKMPLGVQAHHAVMDGIHMGRFYERMQDYLYHPEMVFGNT